MLTALKGSIYFYSRTSSLVQIIFSCWSFEISEGIIKNQKFIIGLDSFSIWPYLDPVESCKVTVFLFGSIFATFKWSLKRPK